MLANGTTETIDMRRKRSGLIYKEIMAALAAVDLSEKFDDAKAKAEIMSNPYLKWTKREREGE